MSSILVTGGSGFVGNLLIDYLERSGEEVRLLGRRNVHEKKYQFFYTDFSINESYQDALEGVSTVVHCAARVHVMNETSQNPIEEFRNFNVDVTLALAKQAADAGVKRFIFLSTIKVNGESTTNRSPFSVFDTPNPVDPYGISKKEAEEGIKKIARETGMEFVIIRPPLVYGPGVKANFASLMRLVNKNIPLPFRLVNTNKRSMVSVTNLVDLIYVCAHHVSAKNQTFLVSDDNDVSTAKMVKLMSVACNTHNFSIPVPSFVFKIVGNLINKNDMIDRLIGSLEVNIEHTQKTLGWTPRQSLLEGFSETANWLKKV